MPSFALTLVALFVTSVLAQTSLFIPGFDPQAISADVLGVDAQGRTTWAIHKGALTGTFDDSGLVGTATMVEGPSTVSFTYAPSPEITLGISCSLSGDLAVCSESDSGEGVNEVGTFITTETVSRFLVQVGSTAPAAAPTPDTTPSPASLSKPSGTSPTQPTKGDSTPKPTSSSNAKALRPYIVTLSISIAMVALLI